MGFISSDEVKALADNEKCQTNKTNILSQRLSFCVYFRFSFIVLLLNIFSSIYSRDLPVAYNIHNN